MTIQSLADIATRLEAAWERNDHALARHMRAYLDVDREAALSDRDQALSEVAVLEEDIEHCEPHTPADALAIAALLSDRLEALAPYVDKALGHHAQASALAKTLVGWLSREAAATPSTVGMGRYFSTSPAN